nr:MAG TPA: hypothetical protein [Caudoviricetes sp.]
MKIRYILLVAIAFAFLYYGNEKQRKVDFYHCKATTKLSNHDCSKLTGYELKSK